MGGGIKSMIQLWLSLIFTLIVQEFASAGAAMIAAEQNHINIWIIHAIWVGGTAFDIVAGYLIAGRVRPLVSQKFRERTERWAEKFKQRAGKYGINIAILLTSIVDYAWFNAFLAGWIDVPFKNILIFTFIGNFIWYVLEWVGVLGIVTFAPQFNYWLLVAAGGCIVAIMAFGFWRAEK